MAEPPRAMEWIDESRLRALVSLLSDDNPRILREARRAIESLGATVLPFLAEAARAPDARLRVRARFVHEELRVRLLADQLAGLRDRLQQRSDALEEATVLLAQTRSPDFDTSAVCAALDAMADDLATRVEGQSSPKAVAHTLSRFLGSELGFRGNLRNYYDPDNSYIHQVLERRLGIPISLAAVYLFVARRVGLPLQGIGMPGHFLLRYGDLEPALYLDPFQGGRMLGLAECRQMLQEGKLPYRARDFEPVSDFAMLQRMIGNLQLVYQKREDRYQLQLLEAFKQALRSPDSSHGAAGEVGVPRDQPSS